jgi:alpha-tubulin suppressor-like RCC1 family protein
MCTLLNDSSVKCWGLNNYGQLGLGDKDARGNDLNEMGDNLPTVKLFSAFW